MSMSKSERQKIALVMRGFGFKYREIAVLLDMSITRIWRIYNEDYIAKRKQKLNATPTTNTQTDTLEK